MRLTRTNPAVFLLLPLLLVTQACTTNKATGRKQLNYLTPQKEVALGAEAAPQFLKDNGGPIPSPAIQKYVSDIGLAMAAKSERPDLPWEFFTLDSSVINAFALPGGKVFITRGLLSKLNSEAMLAGVLGHEIGHVTAKHINDRMVQQMGVSLALIGLGAAAQVSDEDWLKVLGVGAQVGGTVYLLSYTRDQETESDILGVRYMTRVGYNPVGQVQVMEVLRAAGGGGGQPEFLSTHPAPDTRIRALEKHIKKKYPRYQEPDFYKFNFEQFNATVLTPLSKLPPPKHNPK